MATLLLFIILISSYGWCSTPKHTEISKVFRDKRFSGVNDDNNTSLEGSYESSSGEDTNSEENYTEGILDHEISYSEHEHPREVSTHVNYTGPGNWAKPSPEKDIPLDFVPTKLYAQVRASHTIKHVPQEEAIETAETKEDKENAARLREVVTNSKTATVYTEEGYEDAAYDHGGQARDANFDEDYARKLDNELDTKIPENFRDEDQSDESTAVVNHTKPGKKNTSNIAKKPSKNLLKKIEIHPKFVFEKEIDQLERDIERSDEEVARGSEIYGAEKLTKVEDHDYGDGNLTKRMFKKSSDSQSSENASDTDAKENSTREVYTVRPRKKPARKQNSQKSIRASKKRDKAKVDDKAIPSENDSNFSRAIEEHKEIIHLKPSLSTSEDYRVVTSEYTLGTETPTTTNYGEMFWKYFKERQDQRASQQPKVFKRKTTTHPDMIPTQSAQEQKIGKNQSLDEVSTTYYPSTIGPTTFAPPRQTEKPELISTTYSVPVTNFPSRQGITHFDHNPFLIEKARSSEANIPRYSVLIRNKTNDGKETDRFQNPKQTRFKKPISKQSNIKHGMLDHLRNSPKFKIFQDNINTRSNQDYSFKKPLSKEITDQLPHPYVSATDYLTRTKQSRILKESDLKLPLGNPVDVSNPKLLMNLHLIKSGRFPGSLPRTNPNKKLLHLLSLQPPAPFSKSEYAEYQPRSKRSDEKKVINGVGSKKKIQFPVFDFPFIDSSTKRRIKRNTRREAESSAAEPGIELLNESPKITNEVIDSELRTRFGNENKTNHKTNDSDKNIEIEIPDFEYVDEFNDENPINSFDESSTEKMVVDIDKYPFYANDAIPSSLALRYIVNPKRTPNKTLGGMEFYNSRNLLRCNEVNPSLENVVPNEEEPVENRDLKEDLPRLQGLGDKLDCFKAKYFDDNPLDNPLFLESQVEQPTPPEELTATKFVSRITNVPSDSHPRILNNRRYYEVPKQSTERHSGRSNKNNSYVTTPYQVEVYEDVRAAIRNLKHMYRQKKYEPTTLETTLLITTPPTVSTISPPRRHPITSGYKYMWYSIDSNQEDSNVPLIETSYRPHEGLIPPFRNPRILRTLPYRNNIGYPMKINGPRINNPGFIIRRYPILQLNNRNNLGTHSPRYIIQRSKRSITDPPFENGEISNKTIDPDSGSTPGRTEEKFSNLKSTSLDMKEKNNNNNTRRMVYTIRDRIRHSKLKEDFSKPKEDFGRYGKFTTELMPLEVDSRRQEPRYNPIRRRKVTSPTVPTVMSTESNISTVVPIISSITIPSIGNPSATIPSIAIPSATIPSINIPSTTTSSNKPITPYEQREASTEVRSEHEKEDQVDSAERSSGEDQEESDSRSDDETKEAADVFKDVSEEKPHAQLIEYLQSDPPGYEKAFGKEDTDNDNLSSDDRKQRRNAEEGSQESSESSSNSKESSPNSKESSSNSKESSSNSKEYSENSAPSNSKEYSENSAPSKSKEYSDNSASSNSKEDSENSASESQEEKNADHSTSVEAKDSKGDEKFERFNSRPFSPPEDFEDIRYSDLGPRINKPAFYHPPFIVPEYEKSFKGKIINKSGSQESEESGEEEKYVSPWESDENSSREEEDDEQEDGKESQHFSSVLRNIEYPWEKRNRLMKDKKNRNKIKYITHKIDSDVNAATKKSYTVPSDLKDAATTEHENKFSIRNRHQPRNDTNSSASVINEVQTSLPIVYPIGIPQGIPFSNRDSASNIIRKRNGTKGNSRISNIGMFDSKQVNATKPQNRKRGRSVSTTIPTVTIRTISARRRSSVARIVDKNSKENVSRNVAPPVPTEGGINSDIPRIKKRRSKMVKKSKDGDVADTGNQDGMLESKKEDKVVDRVKMVRRKRLKAVSPKSPVTKMGRNNATGREAPRRSSLELPITGGINGKIDSSSNFDGINVDDNQTAKLGTTLSSDIYILGNMMKNISSQFQDGYGSSENQQEVESNEREPVDYIRDPSKRLYYYINNLEES